MMLFGRVRQVVAPGAKSAVSAYILFLLRVPIFDENQENKKPLSLYPHFTPT